MLRALKFVWLWALLSGFAFAGGIYLVTDSHSHIQFSLVHVTNTVRGRFAHFDSHLAYASGSPEKSTIKFEVDVDSIDTGNPARDAMLRSDEYFHADRYPEMTFQSTAFKKVGEGRFLVTGTLTIKGHSETISVPVTITRTGRTWMTGQETVRFQGNFAVDRTEFGVGKPQKLLANEVGIALDLEFRGAK